MTHHVEGMVKLDTATWGHGDTGTRGRGDGGTRGRGDAAISSPHRPIAPSPHRPITPSPYRRVRFWLWGLLLLGLVACGRGNSPTPTTGSPVEIEGPSSLQTFVVTDDFAVGQPRVPFVLYDGPSTVATAQAVHIELRATR
jgi:hypothetical protein